jgi:hypothetical protein
MGQFMRRRQARSFLMASRQTACSVHVSGHESGGLNFGLLRPWWRESVPPDPMRTGSSRVAHGTVNALKWSKSAPFLV